MSEPETYPCTYCDKVFTRAYQLKKHIATHENPTSVHYCPQCEFFSLQKKNLVIHFAIHTGEKLRKCPDMNYHPGSDGSPPRVECCDYKTNDPAALTKHRKKKHGYVPPPNRTRGKTTSTSPKPNSRKMEDGTISRRYHPYKRPVTPVPPSREPSLVTSITSSSDSSLEPPSICSELSAVSSPFVWPGDADEYGRSADTYLLSASGCESSLISSATTLVVPEDNTKLGTIYDPTLDPDWMAWYEMSYSSFDMIGTSYLPKPFDAVSSFSDSLTSEARTGREGCMCPDWMVEAGIESWDQFVLDAHKEFYGLNACS